MAVKVSRGSAASRQSRFEPVCIVIILTPPSRLVSFTLGAPAADALELHSLAASRLESGPYAGSAAPIWRRWWSMCVRYSVAIKRRVVGFPVPMRQMVSSFDAGKRAMMWAR